MLHCISPRAPRIMAEEEEIAAELAGEGAVDEEIEKMKEDVKAMEDEAEKLRKIQEQTEEELNGEAEGEGEGEENELDARSIYVGQVEYKATPEELQEHFAECGTVNRVTILCDKFKNPKGYAYIEFAEEAAVEAAVALNDSEFLGRQLKVVAKRTNKPGMRGGKGKGGRGRGKGGRGKGYGKGYGKGWGKGWGKGYGAWGGKPSYSGRGYKPY